VADSGLGAIYEFDLGRRRFLGPAPSTRAYEFGRLPGYPTTLPDTTAPQDATVVGHTLYVGGGNSGNVVSIPITSQGLGTPAIVALPEVVTHDKDQSGPVRTAISKVAGLPDGGVLAVGRDQGFGVEVAYVVDPTSGSASATAQLPGGVTIGPAVPVPGGVALAMSGGTILLLDEHLGIRQVAQLGAAPDGIAASGGLLYVSARAPARLFSVDLRTGATRLVDSDPHSIRAGPVATDPSGNVYWHLNDIHAIRKVDAGGRLLATLRSCVNMNHLVWSSAGLLATCLGGARLALIAPDGSSYATTRAGYFPQGIAVTP
jgi:hypothetical protein